MRDDANREHTIYDHIMFGRNIEDFDLPNVVPSERAEYLAKVYEDWLNKFPELKAMHEKFAKRPGNETP